MLLRRNRANAHEAKPIRAIANRSAADGRSEQSDGPRGDGHNQGPRADAQYTVHTSMTTGSSTAQPRARRRCSTAFRKLSMPPIVVRPPGSRHGPGPTHSG